MSIGNAALGIRANFEERYSGPSLQGSYLAGVYYPDKTRVGWWKNGYPEYFAKILNAVKWIGVDVVVNGQVLDIAETQVGRYERKLDMKRGVLGKVLGLHIGGADLLIHSELFCSVARKQLCGVSYRLENTGAEPIELGLISYLDCDVRNADSNYDEKFWEPVDHGKMTRGVFLHSRTRKTDFHVVAAQSSEFRIHGEPITHIDHVEQEYAAHKVSLTLEPGQSITLEKVVALTSSFQFGQEGLTETTERILNEAVARGFREIRQEHIDRWDALWQVHDVVIDGDVEAQQGIRFCIYQFLQAFDGQDPRLNIGPKGFTGEKYGGLSYWDTEAFCLPYVMGSFKAEVSRNLLRYRYDQLPQAIRNAEKLGFHSGAALYPMVTINGEECHNEWEITFEEIHRNGAIAYAIWHESVYSGKTDYLYNEGLEVLTAICRFWAQRVNFSKAKDAYVILGVTGPNEYENNVNNNWYTNFMAKWCLETTVDLYKVRSRQNGKGKLTSFATAEEVQIWTEIAGKIYLPVHPDNQLIFLQQDGFLDKDLQDTSALQESDIPLHHHWSWDRILRSCYIKQADVLQGISFFPDRFTDVQKKANLDFYLPMTVHESSLSPSVYSTVSSWVGDDKKAYELFLRAARLDIDDYNSDAVDGLHVTSMAGAWNAIVMGFAGVYWLGGELEVRRTAWPQKWESLHFHLMYRDQLLAISASGDGIRIEHKGDMAIPVVLYGRRLVLTGGQAVDHTHNPVAS